MLTTEELKLHCIGIEREMSNFVSKKADYLRNLKGGEKLANEMVMSVAAMFAGRAVAIVHAWTGEPVESVRGRFNEAMDVSLRSSMRQLFDNPEM